MIRQCAWCHLVLGIAPGPPDQVTSGICPDCRARYFTPSAEDADVVAIVRTPIPLTWRDRRSAVAEEIRRRVEDWRERRALAKGEPFPVTERLQALEQRKP
jgi:hypothetical protein